MKTYNRFILSAIVLTGTIALCGSVNVIAAPQQDKMKAETSKMQPAKSKQAENKKNAPVKKAKKTKADKMAMDTASKM